MRCYITLFCPFIRSKKRKIYAKPVITQFIERYVIYDAHLRRTSNPFGDGSIQALFVSTWEGIHASRTNYRP